MKIIELEKLPSSKPTFIKNKGDFDFLCKDDEFSFVFKYTYDIEDAISSFEDEYEDAVAELDDDESMSERKYEKKLAKIEKEFQQLRAKFYEVLKKNAYNVFFNKDCTFAYAEPHKTRSDLELEFWNELGEKIQFNLQERDNLKKLQKEAERQEKLLVAVQFVEEKLREAHSTKEIVLKQISILLEQEHNEAMYVFRREMRLTPLQIVKAVANESIKMLLKTDNENKPKTEEKESLEEW